MDTDLLDLPQAAEHLGVHYQTAYKWVRAGDLPAEVVAGKYRLRADDVDSFASRRAAPAPARVRRPRRGFEPLADRALAMLKSGDERGLRTFVQGLVDDGISVTTVLEKVISPCLRTIGDEWHRGVTSIAVEHRATAIVERLVGDHHPTPRGRRRGIAVVAGPAGERHVLVTAMAAAALREANWHVQHLGGDLPTDVIVRFCTDHPVDLLVVSATTDAGRAEAEVIRQRLADSATRVLVGRPGATLTELQEKANQRP